MRRLLLAIVLWPVLLAAGPATAAQAYDVEDLRAKLSREMQLAGGSSGALDRVIGWAWEWARVLGDTGRR